MTTTARRSASRQPSPTTPRKTMTTERDLIQRLIDIADALDGRKPLVFSQGQAMDGFTALANFQALANEARAYLSQPEPQGLTEDEILKISDQFDIDGTEDVTKGMPLDTFWDSYQPQQLIAFARAVIAADRACWGRATVEPPIKPAHNTAHREPSPIPATTTH